MAAADLNGWTAPRLDDLAGDVRELKASVRKIEGTLEEMQGDKVKGLEDQVQALKKRESDRLARYRLMLLGFVPPIVAAVVSGLITTHVL